MLIGYNGATTMTSPYEVDVQIASAAGYDVLEITATKLDQYLQTHSLADARKLLDDARLKAYAINSIEKIASDPREKVLARTRQLSEYARARLPLDCRRAWTCACRYKMGDDSRRHGERSARDERHRRFIQRQPRVRVSGLWVVLGADAGAELGDRAEGKQRERWLCD